jgi:hypothetical protein
MQVLDITFTNDSQQQTLVVPYQTEANVSYVGHTIEASTYSESRVPRQTLLASSCCTCARKGPTHKHCIDTAIQHVRFPYSTKFQHRLPEQHVATATYLDGSHIHFGSLHQDLNQLLVGGTHAMGCIPNLRAIEVYQHRVMRMLLPNAWFSLIVLSMLL